MRVLFLNRVYPPADGATGRLLAELAPELARRGCEVTVVTSRPDRGTPRSETVEGVRVERVNVPRLIRSSHLLRALSYLAVYPALLWRALRLPRADVTVTMTDPPLLAVLGPVLKWVKGCRLVHWGQDLYPEVAEELGVLRKGGWLATLCTRLSNWACRRHEKLIVVGRCMKDRLVRRGLPQACIHVVPNWTHPTQPVEPAENVFRREQQIEDRWVVMYSGNLGLAHPFGAILDAACRLRAARPEILFLIVGTGPRLAQVKQQAQLLGLDNVRFLPSQRPETLAHSLSAADVHVACMVENLCGLVVPSKVYGVLAAGRPCLFLGPESSEAARVIREFGCGSVLDPGDGEGLARCIVNWANHGQRLREAGLRAREAAREFSLHTAASAFHEMLAHAMPGSDKVIVLPLANTGSERIESSK